MRKSGGQRDPDKKRSIFRSLFIPLFLTMVVQALIFYVVAVYGGIENSLSQNAVDILSERLVNRKNELETQFNGKWSSLNECRASLLEQYQSFENAHGGKPLAGNAQLQIEFLRRSADVLIHTLRHNEVNGIFLILNDRVNPIMPDFASADTMYGLCIRDMDQDSPYTAREDLQVERSPSSIVYELGCSLDSWWESRYAFHTAEEGCYYYQPLFAALQHPGADGDDLAYLSGVHRISDSDPEVISFSLPLISSDGYPYGVLGVELTTRYLASRLPYIELSQADKGSYVLAMREAGATDCEPLVGTGILFGRGFEGASVISTANTHKTGGFRVTGQMDIDAFGVSSALKVYNHNNPFEHKQLVLLALVEESTLFAFIDQIKIALLFMALISLALGIVGILWVSRRFAAPITALAGRVRGMEKQPTESLGRLGITEIDQLVESIEELNRNVSKNSARTEFFSRMSHDMRTPMNAIISFSSSELLEGATESVKDEYLQKIHASGEYLLGLINEVLDMTKIESNKTDLHMATIRADQLCAKNIPIIDMLTRRKGVAFEHTLDVPADLYVVADEQHINQIVMNLLSNAVKFTPEGGSVRLAVRFEIDAADEHGTRCVIVVRDTGIGMSEAFMKHLYKPFEQEHIGREGTGLGLSIAKKLIELMGGTIECESRQNHGTTFTVRLTLARGQKEDAVDLLAPSADQTTLEALKGKHVLVCEDNAINAQIIDHLLKKKGMRTCLVINGQAGVEQFSSSEPYTYDIVLMDIQMPVMNGLDATRAIRALNRPDAATVPIIAMTANAFDQDVQSSSEAGMNEHLAKPIEPWRLFDAMKRYLCGERRG